MSGDPAWLSTLHPGDAPTARLVCIPYSGADAHAFASWRAYMPPEMALVGVHLPGRGRRLGEPRDADLEVVASRIAEALRELPPLPTVMFGHSLGGLLCYEAAIRIEASCRPGLLRHVFFSGCSSPRHHATRPRVEADLSDESIRRRILRYKGTPLAVLNDPEAFELFLPVLREDFRMIDAYRPAAPVPVSAPMTVFAGTLEPIADEQLAQWATLARSSFSSHRFKGGHFFIKSNRTLVIQRIFAEIEATTGIRHRPQRPVAA